MCPLPLMSTGIGLILARSSGGAMPPFGSAGKCLREEPNGQKRAVRERNRRKHPPAAGVQKTFYIPHQAAARNWGDYLTGHYKALVRVRRAASGTCRIAPAADEG